jgi:hypothetical protein
MAQPSKPIASPPTRSPVDMSGLDGVGAELAMEKSMAGKSDPSATAVWTAFREKGHVELVEEMQPLATPVGARFCERMTSKHDVYAVVCEFADEGAALKGQTAAKNARFKNREVLQRRSATCAIHRTSESAEAVAEAKRMKEVFLSL